MYKNAVLSEILFCMALRLKGGVRIKRIWTRKHRAYLESILSFMGLSADLLETKRDLTKEEILPIVEFVNSNVGELFPTDQIDIEAFCNDNGELVLINNCNWDENDDRIISAMRYIISENRRYLNERSNGYKNNVANLFHAYHNLPRAYLSRSYDVNNRTTFLDKDYTRWATSKSHALEFSGFK